MEHSPEEIIEAMVKFMENTNEILSSFKLRIENLELDIKKINKEINKKSIVLANN